jgi:adenosine deaminase
MNRYGGLPKAEIHLHLEGSVDLDTVLQIRRGRGEPAGSDERWRLGELYRHRDFPHFLRNFKELCGELRGPADFGTVTAALSTRLRGESVRYAEVFCSPTIFARAGLPFGEIMEAIAAAARRGEAEGGPRMRFLFDGVRQLGVGPLESMVEMAVAYRGYGVIGIGMGGDERSLPAKDCAPVFREARRLGLRTTAHAGEFDGPRSVWEALEVLEVERIGHGIRAVEDAVLLRALRSHVVPLECCPTSNLSTGVVTSWETHPIRTLHAEGCAVTVNSDDPALFETSIAEEWRRLETRLGMSRDDVLAIGARTIEASFLEAAGKRDLLGALRGAAAAADES